MGVRRVLIKNKRLHLQTIST